jgi:Na+-driven multidrug efflux pump
MKIQDTIVQGTFGINVACSTMIGQNFGAGNHDRVKRTLFCAWGFSAICYGLFAALLAFSPHGLYALFTSESEVLALSPLFVTSTLLSYPGFVIMRGTNGLVQGTGFALLGFCASLFDAVILRVGLSMLFGFALNMGLFGFFLGFALAVYGSALPQLGYFLSGKWRNRKLLID